MAQVTFTLTNTSITTPVVINYMTFDTDISQIRHTVEYGGGWNAPFNSYTGGSLFTGTTTVQTFSKTITSVVHPISRVIKNVNSLTNSIRISSTSSVQVGWGVRGGFIEDTSPQLTVDSISNDWVTLAGTWDSIPVITEGVVFLPPENLVQVNDTVDLTVGLLAHGNGYNGQNIQELRPSNVILLDGPPGFIPTVGNSINFSTYGQNMITIPPSGSVTMKIDYVLQPGVGSYTVGTYTSLVKIFGFQGTETFVKPIYNFQEISLAPVIPSNPYVPPPPPPPPPPPENVTPTPPPGSVGSTIPTVSGNSGGWLYAPGGPRLQWHLL